MKKVLILLIFTIMLSFNTVSASQPIQDGLIKIELEKCDSRNLDYSDLRIDILLKTDDLRGNEIYIDYFNVDFDNPVMFELYKTNK